MADVLSREASYVPRAGETWRDPFGMYAALREHDPVHHVAAGDYWVLTRHRDVLGAVRDHETFSSAQGLTTSYDELERDRAGGQPADGDDRPALAHRVPAAGLPWLHAPAGRDGGAGRALLRRRAARPTRAAGGGDIVVELFKPLPSMVVAHYLGVPGEDREQFDAWTDAIVAANATSSYAEVGDAVARVMGYFAELIERRRAEPERRHRLAPGRGGRGWRRRRPAARARLHVHDGRRRQRHVDRPARWRGAAARPTVPTSV